MSISTYGSLFAGVGGIDLGLDQTGMECKFQVEIDQNCQQTLSYHWPDVPKFGDIKSVSGYDLPFVDVITFGSPCQDLSVAGKRAGLEGEKSGLFHEAVRIIKEMREKSNGQYPKWSIWENVTGALSSNGGADFGQVLNEMDEAGACFSEWSVLDAQHFGVPQRRRRIYLLSVFDPTIASRCPDKVLPVNESSAGNSKKSIKQGQEPSREVASCLGGSGEGAVPSSRGQNLAIQMLDAQRVGDVRLYEEPVQTLPARMGTGGNNVPLVVDNRTTSNIVGTLSARDFKGVGNQYVQEHKLVVESSNPIYVRRLTPTECERLMGWPDNHTLHRADGKVNSDSTRYKMCGNGVASPVIKWVIEKIKNI